MDKFADEVVPVMISYYPPEDGPQGWPVGQVRVQKNLSMSDISELLLWLDSRGE